MGLTGGGQAPMGPSMHPGLAAKVTVRGGQGLAGDGGASAVPHLGIAPRAG